MSRGLSFSGVTPHSDANGYELSPAQIDWYSTEAVNYRFKQDPGDSNSLGSIRINFPSAHGVYMHDTPYKNLFGDDFRFRWPDCGRLGLGTMAPLQPNGREVLFEFTAIGAVAKVAAIDGATGLEVSVMDPVHASRADCKNLLWPSSRRGWVPLHKLDVAAQEGGTANTWRFAPDMLSPG